jgi:hypothetical protein
VEHSFEDADILFERGESFLFDSAVYMNVTVAANASEAHIGERAMTTDYGSLAALYAAGALRPCTAHQTVLGGTALRRVALRGPCEIVLDGVPVDLSALTSPIVISVSASRIGFVWEARGASEDVPMLHLDVTAVPGNDAFLCSRGGPGSGGFTI